MTGPVAGRDAAGAPGTATGRDAIVRAARRAFTRLPYADVTVRGIAADAGVSPSLVVKRFGSKEQLFSSVADFRAAADQLLAAPLEALGHHMALTLVRAKRADGMDPLLRVVFSLGIDDERSLLRERFQEQVTARLTERLRGEDRALRAELVAGQLVGLGAALSIHLSGASASADAERIADLYAPALQCLLGGG
jgi:AcrR family transcriptional regulator